MSAEQEGRARSAEFQPALQQAIERQIVHRTCGRIQALEVEVTDNRVAVRGRAPSYYVEQLALQGVLDVTESAGAMLIELNIQVGSPPKSSALATERRLMNDNARATANRDALLDHFAAELTRAAYHVALRHGAAGAWLDLELDLWRVVADTVRQWGRSSPPGQVPLGSPDLPHEAIP
jgi:hypothetical protein